MERAMSIAALIAALAFVGCSSAHRPAAKQGEAPKACEAKNPVLTISASERSNASTGGQGRPVQVRIYQLKSDARLKNAKFEEIWQGDAAALQTELVKMDEYTVYPGQTKQVTVTPSPDARTLAAVALFREPQGKSWFLTYDLEPPKKEPPCPASEPQISIWIDRMQIEDGQGRTSAGETGSRGE